MDNGQIGVGSSKVLLLGCPLLAILQKWLDDEDEMFAGEGGCDNAGTR